MICFVDVTDIILMSVLMRNPCSALRNLMKMTKLYQFLKNQTKLRLKKTRRQT